MSIIKGGIAWFMPAYNEAGNLPTTVSAIVEHLSGLGGPFTVFIIDDGSTDRTPQVAQELCEQYPNVELVTHPKNLGYGAALITGFKAGLDTDHALIGFCDADCQFDIGDLSLMLDVMETQMADAVLGIRAHRADSLKRRVMGWGWHQLTRHVLGFRIKDVDCGFKLFRRDVLKIIVPELKGGFATTTPELLARMHRNQYVMAELEVTHLPRQAGEQTGANLTVILNSLRDLWKVWWALNPNPMTIGKETGDSTREKVAA